MGSDGVGAEPVFSVSDFVAAFNQTITYAYPTVSVEGELANFRVSKNRWVYFDLKDEYASIRFFGTVYQLPEPLEDGLVVRVSGQPRLHPQYGFSVTIQSIQLVGEGSLRRAAALLQVKLTREGLFDESRKRPLPYPPRRIGLITSAESAAYHDFIKVLGERWGGIDISLADVQVQGEAAPVHIIEALNYFNTHEDTVDVLVITRGGGSAEDLGAFSTEQVTRAVAASRIPTLVAIGHEVDVSLAELAADKCASTPSNAAQVLTPDRRHELKQLRDVQRRLVDLVGQTHLAQVKRQQEVVASLQRAITAVLDEGRRGLSDRLRLLEALNPDAVLRRGYAIVHQSGALVRSARQVVPGQSLYIKVSDGEIKAEVSKE